MKQLFMITLLVISFTTIAASTCESYIDNQWPDSRYSINTIANETVVTDNETGLMWKQCTEGLSGTNCASGSLVSYTWQQSLDLADTTVFAGYSDWRIPNIKEIKSIMAINCMNPSINENAFPNTPSDSFWTSSPYVGADSLAWIGVFLEGYGFTFDRNFEFRVRLVRNR